MTPQSPAMSKPNVRSKRFEDITNGKGRPQRLLFGALIILALVEQVYADEPWRIEKSQNGQRVIRVIDQPQLDSLLRSKWAAMVEALRNGDTAKASSFIVRGKQSLYKNAFDNLPVSFEDASRHFGDIFWSKQYGPFVEYSGSKRSVTFQLESDNQWRILFF